MVSENLRKINKTKFPGAKSCVNSEAICQNGDYLTMLLCVKGESYKPRKVLMSYRFLFRYSVGNIENKVEYMDVAFRKDISRMG